MDPVMADLDRYLRVQEQAERIWEGLCEWIESGSHFDYFDDEDGERLLVLVAEGTPTPEDQALWDQAEDYYLDSLNPY